MAGAGCALLLGVGAPAASAAPVEHVTNSLDAGPGSLRAAMANVDQGGQIVFDSAAAQPALSSEVSIDKSVTITGLGAGTTAITGSSTSRVFGLSGGITVTIQDLEITGGNAPDGATGPTPGANGEPGESGGAILNTHTDTSLTLTRTLIDGNSAGTGGNGADGDAVENSGNGAAGGAGGAIWSAGTLVVQYSEISDNEAGDGGSGGATGAPAAGASGAAGGDGGGIAATGTVTISNSTIDGNLAGDGGSGMGGSHSGDGGNGGAGGGLKYGGAGTLTLSNVTITANETGAGGPHGAGGSPPNPASAGGSGGGLQTSAAATLTNATIAGNAAANGSPGTNMMSQPTPAIPGEGGGVSGAATLKNTIVSSNNAPGDSRNCDAAVLDGNFNISFPDVAESGCPVGFAHGDPQLGPLAPNGGDTPTMAITNASAAFDHVPASGAGCPGTDQRGVTRPQFAQCDAGAFELASTAPPPSGGGSPPVTSTTPTGKRAAALKKCKKKKTAQARKKCKKKANTLPV